MIYYILPIFFLNSYDELGEKTKKTLDEAINTDPKVQKTITLLINNLLKLPIIQELEGNQKLFALDKKESLEYVLKTCSPLIQQEFKLLPADMFFLERIADILFRDDEQDRMVEYVVRYPEFVVLEHQGKLSDNPEIMTSFKGLAIYWDDYVMKDIDTHLTETVALAGEI